MKKAHSTNDLDPEKKRIEKEEKKKTKINKKSTTPKKKDDPDQKLIEISPSKKVILFFI